MQTQVLCLANVRYNSICYAASTMLMKQTLIQILQFNSITICCNAYVHKTIIGSLWHYACQNSFFEKCVVTLKYIILLNIDITRVKT